jgi:Leucine-rich repeat (LRR) protein
MRIPVLPNLEYLDCTFTKIIEIPILSNLKYLYCHNTRITEIPLLPELKLLDCSNTPITKIPKIKNCRTYLDRCRWLDPIADTLTKIIKIQKLIKQHIKKRIQIMHNTMHTHSDLFHVLN